MPSSPKQHPPSPIRHPQSMEESTTSCCCCGRSSKVQPAPGSYPGYDILEVRPGRHLRIVHLNPRKRDERFQNDMEKFMSAQVRSGKYGTKGKSWNIPQPGRMDKQNASLENAQKHMNDAHAGHNSYQGYHDSDQTHIYKGEDNLSFRAESPDADEQMRKQLSKDSSEHFSLDVRKGSVKSGKRSRHSSTNTEENFNGTVVPGSPTFISGAYCKEKKGDIELARVSTATSVIVEVKEERTTQKETTPNGLALDSSAPPKAIDPAKEHTVIFFIHGVGGSSAVWQAQAEHFMREGYEVVLPDLIGHGFSCAPEDPLSYHFQEIAADLLVIFDLYCKMKNMIVGHSYG